MQLSAPEMIEVARRVLSGEMTYAELREHDRPTQVYTFVAVMLVKRLDYFSTIALQPKDYLYVTFAEFVGGDDDLGRSLVPVSQRLGLHASQGRGGKALVVTPPLELAQLAAQFAPESPGVVSFFESVAAAKQEYEAKRKQRWQEQDARRAALQPIEAAGDALLAEFFTEEGGGKSKFLAERILWELYGPTAKNAAAKIAEAPEAVRAYVSQRLVSMASGYF